MRTPEERKRYVRKHLTFETDHSEDYKSMDTGAHVLDEEMADLIRNQKPYEINFTNYDKRVSAMIDILESANSDLKYNVKQAYNLIYRHLLPSGRLDLIHKLEQAMFNPQLSEIRKKKKGAIKQAKEALAQRMLG